MATRIQHRRGTAAQWTSANPVLAAGEPGYETDTGVEKTGDGITRWVALPVVVRRSNTWQDAQTTGEVELNAGDGLITRIPLGRKGSEGTKLTTEDLDTILTPGTYYQLANTEATPARHYPYAAFGTLQVLKQHVADASVTQIYWANQFWAAGFALRSRYNGAWGTWKFYQNTDQTDARYNQGTQLVTENLDTVTAPGPYWTRQNSEATKAKNYPFEAYGNLTVLSASSNNANVTQVYYPSQRYASGFAMRARHNSAWEAWQYFTPGGGASTPSGGSASGFKVTPLALTLGQTGVEGNLSHHYRLPLNFNAPITRFRVHIRNWNPRLGSVKTGAVNFAGLWLGKHAGSGAFTAAPAQLRGAFATPADGSDWVSTWFPAPNGNLNEQLLSYGYTAPAAPVQLVGGCWYSADPADASAVAPAMGQTNAAPFDIWLEAETPATTPVVGVLGDSLSCGVGSTLPVNDSTISQYARTVGALPYHLAASGDSMAGMLGVNPSKVTRWAGLAKPDSILWAVASNDIADGADLTTLQSRFASLSGIIAGITPNVYLADIMPRDGWAAGSTEEATRRTYNTWLRTLPGASRDVFAFAASVSADDETIPAEYDSGDGTHLNTAGYTANAAAIVRPMTGRNPYTVDQSVGRVVKVWDYLNNRPQMIYGDTGLRDLTAQVSNVTSGQITFQHKSGWNVLTLVNVKLAVAGTCNLFPNHDPGLKPWAPGVFGISGGEANEAVTLGSAGTDYRRVVINYTGGTSAYGAVVGDVLNGTITWPMNRPWSTSLPGVAIGSIVV